MPKRRREIWLLTGWRRWTLIGAAALLVGWLVFDGLFGDTLAANAVVRRLEAGKDDAAADMRRMGKPFQSRFRSALLAGGRSFEAQQAFTRILLLEPFYDRAGVDEALRSEDAVVRRAAAAAVLYEYGEIEDRPEEIDDRVLEVLAEWTRHPADPWLPPILGMLNFFEDPRVVDFLLPLVETEPKGDPNTRALIAESRFRAVRRLAMFADQERVATALKALLEREGEAGRIRTEAIRSLASGGRPDPELYWKAARSDADYERQAVAENLALVKDLRVLPVLLELLGDRNVDVRRAALRTLVRKRSPVVMREIDYLAEDLYYGIRADLVMAVGQYREESRIPFLVWALTDFDPEVVRAAYVELVRMTKAHHGFSDDAWSVWGRLPETVKAEKIKDFMNDETRREAAVKEWSAAYPPRKTDRDRVPHLIRMLTHRDSGNVERAMKELVRITKRREGFPAALLDGSVPVEESATERLRFMQSDRAKLADEWRAWWSGQ